MANEKNILIDFLEAHAKNYETDVLKAMKDYERHLMTGALLFAMKAKIITPLEEEELYNRYFGD